MACLLLAAKTEESPKKLITVVQECYRLKNRSSTQNNAEKEKDGVKVDKKGYLDMKCKEFLRLKERVLLLERVILHTIGFELSVAHPYKLVVEQVSFDLVGFKCVGTSCVLRVPYCARSSWLWYMVLMMIMLNVWTHV